MKLRSLWLTTTVLAAAWCGVAQAQTSSSGATPPADQPVNSSNQVSEVVVTAERRTTNLQTTAIAATVLTQSDLLKNGVTTVDQLQFVAPSVVVNNFGQGNDIDIRGIGKGEHNSQTTTGVVTYRDGVATFPGYIQEEPYFDVASVEVLRGPQGTFSGQNATGGALIVNTVDPQINGGYTGYLLGHVGNYSDVGAQGAVNLPISDTLAARVAFNAEHRDTFYNITGLTRGDPDLNWGSVRLSVLWEPTSKLKVSAKLDVGYLDNGGYFGDPLATQGTDHLFDISTNYLTYAVDKYLRLALREDYTLDNGITLRSVTGYQDGSSAWKGDIDGTAAATPNYVINEVVPTTIWSQEFNVISPSTGPFSWILGLYYQHDTYEFPFFNIGVPPGVFDENLQGTNDTHTYAGFGQVTYKLPAGFEIQAGLRYSLWSTTNHGLYYVPEYGTLFNQYQDQRERGNNTTGKVSLNWTINPDNFAYAFIATGAKPGGLNTSLYSYPQIAIPEPFRQEYVTDYEIGLKSRFFDRHLQTQIGFYYNQYKNFQVIIPLPNDPLHATELNNPNTTTLYGFEGSVQAMFGAWTFKGNIGLEHSELGTVFATDSRVLAVPTPCNFQNGPASTTCINLSGHQQTYAPDVTVNFSAQYDFHLGNGDVVSPSVNFAHISDQWGTLFENVAAGDHLSARNILGASVSWTHGPYVGTLYGYNLNDDHYIAALLSPIRIAGPPRQFGVSLLRKF